MRFILFYCTWNQILTVDLSAVFLMFSEEDKILMRNVSVERTKSKAVSEQMLDEMWNWRFYKHWSDIFLMLRKETIVVLIK